MYLLLLYLVKYFASMEAHFADNFNSSSACIVICFLQHIFTLQILGFHLENHFSNSKRNAFCVFKSWLLNPVIVTSSDHELLQYFCFLLHVLTLELKIFAAPGNIRQIHWYIMTSPFTDGVTRKFFESRKYFGLEADQVR